MSTRCPIKQGISLVHVVFNFLGRRFYGHARGKKSRPATTSFETTPRGKLAK
jgi:hypothetical protein